MADIGMPLSAVALRCEHREDVPCLDEPAPRLTWALESAGRDKRQTAYRILVAESPEQLAAEHGSLWDSGQVQSASSVDIAYAGRPLPPATECWWAVQVWDEAAQPGPWSDACFRTGLAEWHADWIRPRRRRRSRHEDTPARIRRRRQIGSSLWRTPLPHTGAVRREPAPFAARCSMRRPAASSSCRSTACVSVMRSWRRAGPTTAGGSSTRRTTSPTCSGRARTCWRPSWATAGTRGSSGSTQAGGCTLR